MTRDRTADLVPYQPESLSDNHGTSTSDAEATLRDIGQRVFGIKYPRNVTPKKQLPTRTP